MDPEAEGSIEDVDLLRRRSPASRPAPEKRLLRRFWRTDADAPARLAALESLRSELFIENETIKFVVILTQGLR